jgi:uncharacterized cupin superfamily protein
MSDHEVIVFNRNGDPETGLQPWDPMAPEAIVSGSPVQRGHFYFSTDNGRLTAGVWDSTPFVEVRRPYEVDEFMLLLEGSLEIENEDGSIQTFHAGDGFMIPKGAVLQWRQSEYLRKFWMIHNNPDSPAAAAGLQAKLLDPNATLPRVSGLEPADFESAVPDMGLQSLYSDPTHQLQIGIWDCAPMTRVPGRLNRSELMHIVTGSGSIINGDGVEFQFNAGDTFFVPIGMGYQWKSHEYVRKLFCSYAP